MRVFVSGGELGLGFVIAQRLLAAGHKIRVAVLGDTGPTPLRECARPHRLRGFSWLARMENELLESSNPHAVVVRPAWEVYGHPWHPSFRGIAIGNLIRVAKRFRRGKYIGIGGNCYSSVHQADLADLYCLALKKFRDGGISQGASENFSMKELAAAIHQGFGFKGEPIKYVAGGCQTIQSYCGFADPESRAFK